MSYSLIVPKKERTRSWNLKNEIEKHLEKLAHEVIRVFRSRFAREEGASWKNLSTAMENKSYRFFFLKSMQAVVKYYPLFLWNRGKTLKLERVEISYATNSAIL